jgi:hypothetical protein
MLGFGPNILHLVDDAVLKDVGFTPGDVIHFETELATMVEQCGHKVQTG